MYGVTIMMVAHTAPPANNPVQTCPRIVTWLRCRECQHGYFTAGAPAPQPCPVCVGGRLVPTSIWDQAHEAAPAGMLRRVEV